MELVIGILSILVVVIFYKIIMLKRYLAVLDFSIKSINKLLVKKEIIKMSDIDIIINESIGDMHENTGNQIIKYAKGIGVVIPEYMAEKELELYVKKQEIQRKNNQVSFTDKMMQDVDK